MRRRSWVRSATGRRAGRKPMTRRSVRAIMRAMPWCRRQSMRWWPRRGASRRSWPPSTSRLRSKAPTASTILPPYSEVEMLKYKRRVQAFSAAEIAEKLKVAEVLRGEGKRVYEIARVLGVTDTTYYNWLKRAEKPMRSEDELRRLRRENARLKRAVKSLANVAGASSGAPQG